MHFPDFARKKKINKFPKSRLPDFQTFPDISRKNRKPQNFPDFSRVLGIMLKMEKYDVKYEVKPRKY